MTIYFINIYLKEDFKVRIESNQINPQELQSRNAQQIQETQRQRENNQAQETAPVQQANEPAAVYERGSRPPVTGIYQRPQPRAQQQAQAQTNSATNQAEQAMAQAQRTAAQAQQATQQAQARAVNEEAEEAQTEELDEEEISQEITDEVAKQQKVEEQADVPRSSEETRGLSSDQLSALNDMFASQQMNMLNQMGSFANNQASNQASSAMYGVLNSASSTMSNAMLNSYASVFGSVEEAIPGLATTPEGAAEAIAPGGAYSVDKVADRLFKFAEEVAGDDLEKMEEMRDAVMQGFEEAGMDLETGEGMPGITKDTYDATMKKFEDYFNKAADTDPILPNEDFEYPEEEVQSILGIAMQQ